MFDSFFNIFLASVTMLAVALFAAAVIVFYRNVETPDRAYMDPLSWRVKIAWPLVVFIAHYMGRLQSTEAVQRNKVALMRAGLSFSLTPEQFFAIQILVAFGALLFVYALSMIISGGISFIWYFLAAMIGYFLPVFKIKDIKKKREKAIVRTLPTYLDFITMAVEAGLSLAAAIVKATTNGPPGLLRQELERVNRDIRAGAGRIEALEAMSSRLEIREVTQVVSALAQAEKTGSSVGETLRIQAEQQRVERFQRAEKKAMEAPVKLIFPLVAFIFPATFIVLGFPIVMRLVHGI